MRKKEMQPKPIILLLISDDERVIKEIKQVFNICMPEIFIKTIATNKDSISAACFLKPEIIILDLDGNDTDNFDILSKIRAESLAPLITLSCSKDRSILIKALDLEADNHIAKPFHQLELIAHVRSLLRRNQHQFGHLQNRTLQEGNMDSQ